MNRRQGPRRGLQSKIGRFVERAVANTPDLVPPAFLADLAVGLWRAQVALKRDLAQAPDLDGGRSWRALERVWALLEKNGVTISDKTGERYDAGMSFMVVSCEEAAHLSSEMILETLAPTVFLNGVLLRAGEIVVGKPKASTDDPN